MLIFTNDLGVMQNLAYKYKKSGEVISLSPPIELEGKEYREIIYKGTFMGKPKKDISGLLFATEEGELVTNERVIKELLSLSYYMEITLDDTSLQDFNKAMASTSEIKREADEYEIIIAAFEELKENGTENLEKFQEILIKLPYLKIEGNDVITKYLDTVNSYSTENFVFNEEILDNIMPLYRNVLLKNIERVKWVNSGRNIYDDIKEKAYQLRKKYRWKFTGRGNVESLAKLDQTIGYFKRMLSVYEQVLNLSTAQYLKYIKEIENQRIEDRQKLIRK